MSKKSFYPKFSQTTLKTPTVWWQLPFAFALASRKFLPACCLCGVNPCQLLSAEQVIKNCNLHWFNRMRFLCQDCHDNIAWQQSRFTLNFSSVAHSPSLEGLASTFYQYPFDTVIRGFKNQHQLQRLPLLIHAIRQLDLPHGCYADNSLILPMPTTQRRLTNRGFDPVTLLVKYLSFHWQLPIFPHIVRQERQKQQGLDKAQRLENTENAFTLTQSPFDPAYLDGRQIKHLIVFDDVATTGATLQSLCQTLLNRFPQENFTLHARAIAHGNG